MKIVCMLSLLCLFIAGGVFAADNEVGVLLKEHCSTACHDMTFTCVTLGQKPAPVWKQTIIRMNAKGGDFPKEKMDEAASYLAGLEPGQGVCK